jgi:hypothetical protein
VAKQFCQEKKKSRHLPEYLAHEPPHEPWPLRETVLVIAGNGVHCEYNGLGTLSLSAHCHRQWDRDHGVRTSPGAIDGRQTKKRVQSLTPLFGFSAIQSNQSGVMNAPSVPH